jgi:hypothetical protein
VSFERGTPTKLIGEDFKALANQVAKKLEADFLTLEAREREAEDLRKYLSSRTYFLKVSHIIGRRDPVEVQTCESLPVVGHMKATGRDYDCALSNLWYGIAMELQRLGFCETWEEARVCAVERFSFLPSMGDL